MYCLLLDKFVVYFMCDTLADDKGRLIKATRLKGIKDFKASQYGLHPIQLDTWGHMVFIHLQGGRPPKAPGGESPAGISDWLGNMSCTAPAYTQ